MSIETIKIGEPIILKAVLTSDPDLIVLRGYSAYEVAVRNGFGGTETEWLASLAEQATIIALGYANEAEAAQDKAEKWAENPEDSPVEIGKYSAKHWAAKAEDVVDEAYAVGENKIDKTAVKQEIGASTTDVMSQKAVTDELAQLAGEVNQMADGIQSNGSVLFIIALTQTEYDNITIKDPYTLYFIKLE